MLQAWFIAAYRPSWSALLKEARAEKHRRKEKRKT
jgi:hypothetical protein